VRYNLRLLCVIDILRLNSSVRNLILLITIFHYSLLPPSRYSTPGQKIVNL